MPTILDLFGIEHPPKMEGNNLIRLARGEEEPNKEVYVNQGLWTGKRAVRTDKWKLIRTFDKAFWNTPDLELYDMGKDPDETENMVAERPEVVDKLDLEMERWLRKSLGKRMGDKRSYKSNRKRK